MARDNRRLTDWYQVAIASVKCPLTHHVQVRHALRDLVDLESLQEPISGGSRWYRLSHAYDQGIFVPTT